MIDSPMTEDEHRAVCVHEAGHAVALAQQLHRGEAPGFFIDECDERPDDSKKAVALERLLPRRNEIDPLHALLTETMRRPDVWALVLRLADALSRQGTVEDEDLAARLPAPIPNWPPSPMATRGRATA